MRRLQAGNGMEWLIKDHNYLWVIEFDGDHNYLWVIEYDERVTCLEDRIFLIKSLNEFYVSVQVLITSYNKLFIRCFVFWTGAEYLQGTSVYCTVDVFMYYVPAEGKASSLSQRSQRREYAL